MKQDISPFQQRVYDALLFIPKGKVTTYESLGKFIACESSQAVGQALTKNLNVPIIPCHRVIRKNGHIGGYAFGISQKKTILKREGICFDEDNFLLDSDVLWLFP